MNWRKSSYSGDNGGACVEVAAVGNVYVRDTTDRGGVSLSVSASAWRAFAANLKRALAARQAAATKGAPSARGCPLLLSPGKRMPRVWLR
jgi:hypothetical protein